MKLFTILIALLGCSSQIAHQPDAAMIDGPVRTVDAPYTPFMLKSSVIAAGAPFAIDNTCDGLDASPVLAWLGAPGGAMSFAVTLSDKTIDQLQWVIYDIPTTRTGLPTRVDQLYAPANVAGAHQTVSYSGTRRGYRGPCPPVADAAHTYELAVYALDVTKLPSATSNTTAMQAATMIMQHQLEVATLAGTYARGGSGSGQ
jgi:Raf kinase inhibitor-like YbhB/YbcL family protein